MAVAAMKHSIARRKAAPAISSDEVIVFVQVSALEASRARAAIRAIGSGYRHLDRADEVGALVSIGRRVTRAVARMRATEARFLEAVRSAMVSGDA